MGRYPVKLIGEPGRIGPLRLKNRLIMGPMGTNYGTTDGFSTERDKLYYAERARGGVGMIVTEAMNISAGARNHNNSLCVFHDRFIPGLSAVVRAIQDNGALAVAQLNHRGQLLRRSVTGAEPVGPTAGTHPFTGEPVRALLPEEIRTIQRDFVSAARRLWRAGYDGVEIHAANGYLFQQFFSERFNKRTDRYGGTLDNRMRLLLETVRMCRDDLPDFPLLVRISATEYAPGGYTESEAIALAQALEREGVVAIDLSGGSNEHPTLSRYCIQPPSFPRRCLEPYARPLKAALKVPVIIAGRIITPEDAEGVLAAGSADYVSIGRALIADPHWCAKALGEIDAPIRWCISCNVCFERLTLERDVSCVANPMVGTEFETLDHLEPQLAGHKPPAPLRVLVLGAGVAGVEAARTARALGHEVEVWEKSEKAGGQLPLALASPDKEDVAGIWTYRESAIEELRVPIRLSVTPRADVIRRHDPDLVVVATGSRSRTLPLRLDLGVPVHQAWDVLLRPDLVARNASVTVIGGGLVGIEAADLLATTRGCRVTVIELQKTVAREMARNNRFEVLTRLDELGATILTEAMIETVVDGEFVLACKGEEMRLPPGDAVVVAIGPEAERSALDEVLEAGLPYVLVGDANQPGDFGGAIRDGSMVALALENRAARRAVALTAA